MASRNVDEKRERPVTIVPTRVRQRRGTRKTPPQPVTQCARWAGPREHGRQAARSKRDRPERARKSYDGTITTAAPPEAACLIS
jgi:hypothetical protein